MAKIGEKWQIDIKDDMDRREMAETGGRWQRLKR